MDADAGASVRRKKDSSLVRAAEAVRDGRASRHGQRRQHRGHHGQRAAAHGPHPGRGPPGHRHPHPGARAARPRSCSTPGPTPSATPEWLVQFAQMGAVYARERFGIAAPRVGAAVHRRGGDQGQPAGQGDPQAAGRRRLVGATGARVRRQRRGSRPHDRRGRRGRHRRLHRQRRPQDARGRHAGAGRRRARRPSTPTTPPGRRPRCCCPALRPLYAELDPETDGGAMLLGVDGVCIISHGSSSATAMVNAMRVARDLVAGRPGRAPASAPSPEPDQEVGSDQRFSRLHECTRSGSGTWSAAPVQPHGRPGRRRRCVPCPPRPTSSRARSTARRSFDLIRDRLADILEIEPSQHPRGRFVRRRPRRRLAGPDRAGRGPRGGARASAPSASASTTRTSRT